MEVYPKTPFRVSTGDNHKDHAVVLLQIKELMNGLTDIQKSLFKGVFDTLQTASNLFAVAPTKKIRQKYRLHFETAISKWNKKINKIYDPLTRPLPTINTKTVHVHGSVGCLPVDHDTFNLDGVGKQCVVCSHKTTHNNWPCCVIPQSTLLTFMQNAFRNTSFWVLSDKKCRHASILATDVSVCFESTCCLKSLMLLCQQKHTDHCPKSKDGVARSLCENPIPLKKLIDFLDRNDRKEFTDSMVVDIYKQLMIHEHPKMFGFCTDKKCEYASKPFLLIPPDPVSFDPMTTIHCSFCDKKHHVHGHKQVCPNKDCTVTFCSVCKISPYHDHDVCQGPRDNAGIDEETYMELLRTTKPCPHCKSRTQKVANCDKITCVACNKYWCWRCVQKLDQRDPYRHNCLSADVLPGQRDGAFRDFDVHH